MQIIKKIPHNQAFTLVELVIVILILAILGTIAFISLQGYSQSARDSTRITDLGMITTALDLFNIDAGKYPIPSDGINITYSGAIVWNQGEFGETVFANLKRLSNIPIDPLSNSKYTYSVTQNRNEYQLAGVLESGDLAYNDFLNKSNAGDNIGIAVVKGNYNAQLLNSTENENCNVLAVPSIITNDTEFNNDLGNIIDNNAFVFNGYNNLPSTFKNSKFKADGGFNFKPNKVLSYSGNCLNLTILDDNERVQLLKNLQDSYSGTLLADNSLYSKLLSIDVNTSNPDTETVNLSKHIAENVLNLKISGTSVAGECGSDNGQSLINNPTDLCNKGTSGNFVDNGIGNNFTWTCDGLNGGNSLSCSAVNNKAYVQVGNTNYVNRSSTYNSYHAPCNCNGNKAFDGNLSTVWGSIYGGGTHAEWLSWRYDTPVQPSKIEAITQYLTSYGGNFRARSPWIEASNDGVNWTQIHNPICIEGCVSPLPVTGPYTIVFDNFTDNNSWTYFRYKDNITKLGTWHVNQTAVIYEIKTFQ
ncbi:MAG: prepilin-type N-terminal cleavage/methylation domain-containing protein [Candidatus Gracilibacteria bacterium]|nr:prepilin-type N-terminal cleavage/methylation domain-containing protein [Candidatus Gracilibacteria bacterium]